MLSDERTWRRAGVVAVGITLAIAVGACGESTSNADSVGLTQEAADSTTNPLEGIEQVDFKSVKDSQLLEIGAVNFNVVDSPAEAAGVFLDSIYFECDSECQVAVASNIFSVPRETIASQPEGTFDRTATLYFCRVAPSAIPPLDPGPVRRNEGTAVSGGIERVADPAELPNAIVVATVDGAVTFSATLRWDSVMNFVESEKIRPTRIVW
jgi:hypothetical protein